MSTNMVTKYNSILKQFGDKTMQGFPLRNQKASFQINKGMDRESSKLTLHLEVMPPSISAQSYVIYDCILKRPIFAKKETLKREVASLTKMMTFLTVLKLL